MRTLPVIGFVLAFGVAFAMFSGSGIGTAVFGTDVTQADQGTAEQLEALGEDAGAEGDPELAGDVAGDDEPTVIGLALQAGQFGVSLVAAVAVLPNTLINLGFPAWFAVPLGMAAQVIAFIGLAQFVTGREWL